MKTEIINTIWWIFVTIILFQAMNFIYVKLHRRIWFQPVGWTLFLLSSLLLYFKIDYQIYFGSTKILNFLLGPTTVALAIPLFEQRKKLKILLIPLLFSLVVGSFTAIISSILIANVLGGSDIIVKTVAAKSVTSPIAIGILEKVGGDTSLIAVLVILTGVFGAIFGVAFLNFFKFKNDQEAKGFAMGLASHGIGTARSFQENDEMGAFAGLAIGLNGVVTAILIPIIFYLLKII